MVICALCQAPAHAMPWHAQGSGHRAIVGVESRGSEGVDVAAVRISHGGLAGKDGHDYRIFDQSGTPVPYEITYHHPGRDTLISFRCTDPAQAVAIYFDNADAKIDPMRAVAGEAAASGAPTPGPGAGGWIPRAGLVLTTMRRPVMADSMKQWDNPQTIEQLNAFLRRSPAPAPAPGLDGADYRGNISDSYNPFGDSDYFISVYRGWIRLPQAGRYGFCTASNEASFSFLDGKELVHWPGRHTEQRGKFGQKNAEHDLAEGLHYIEYYHEEVLLYQVAFLGYKPPGAEHYIGIPGDFFPQPHRARVLRYETPGGGRTMVLRPELIDSAWPQKRPSGQYTRYRFIVDAGAEPLDLSGWRIDWSFGDGQSITREPGEPGEPGQAESQVEHVFLTTGDYQVEMTATSPDGQTVKRVWPLTVFAIEHLDGPFKDTSLQTYKPIVAAYDAAMLRSHDLAELARFGDELGDVSQAVASSQLLLERSDAEAADLADAHWIIANHSEDRHEHLSAALQLEPNATKRMHIAAGLINLVGAQQGDLDAAEQLYEQAKKSLTPAALAGKLKAAFRDATIAIGDARLHALQHDETLEAYQLAEALADPPVPQRVRQAKIGAYHDTVVHHLDAGRLEAALNVARQWRNQFPADQLRGEVLFWLGKVHLKRDEPADAIGPLRLAIEVAQGAEFEAEARYLLAQAFGSSGDQEQYRITLQGLISTGLAGEFRDRAVQELAGRQD